MKALGRRMRTESELRRLMQSKVEHPGPNGDTGAAKIAAVLARLKEYGYLDDANFAEPTPVCASRMKSLASGASVRLWGKKAWPARSSIGRSTPATAK